MKKTGSLRKRWIVNTVGLISALGLICVLIITVIFSVYYYNDLEADLRYRARTTTGFLSQYADQSAEDFFETCAGYTKAHVDSGSLELQFIDLDGKVVVSSYGDWVGPKPSTPDIVNALGNGAEEQFLGKDPATGKYIMAVSSPAVCGDGNIIGILRYVTTTGLVNQQIAIVALSCFAALLIVLIVALISMNHYIRSILGPVGEITEKAKRIAGGSYGIQIQTHYDDEIGELAKTINEMSVQINQNEVVQRDFISSLSHELRTPLTAITGWSETLLTSDELNAETTRGMKIILREGRRLTEMVEDLLDFNRIQGGNMTLNNELADIRAEFEDMVYMYSSRLQQDNIRLDNDDVIPEITCDPKRLRQVFLNILDNAAKYGAEGKRIEASIRCDGENVIVQIRDFGPGIPEDELPLVKKKFYKGSSKARGTGIGLAVCDEIVQMHNGELTLENAPGGGTLVTVRIPVSQ